MVKSWYCWVLTAVFLLLFAFVISSPSLAEEAYTLPLDISVPGQAMNPDGWNADFTEYEDPTIHITVEKGSVTPKTKRKELETLIIRIKIQDPSQMRTAMSGETYKGREREEAEIMAKRKNAVVAVNGDFFKYYYDRGYVIRQGEFYRDETKSRYKFDMLLIDDHGDFHAVYNADTKKIKDFLQSDEMKNKEVVNTFNLGPVLIVNGEVQNMKETSAARIDMFQWSYAQQRVCIVQTGPLEYAIVESYGRTDASCGMTLQEFAAYVNEVCPDAIMAYNLDGGGSTNVIVNGKRIHKTPGHREITDILYFASAYKESEE